MQKSTQFRVVLFALLYFVELSAGRTIEHAVVHEKIDRVGSIQDGGAGKLKYDKSGNFPL